MNTDNASNLVCAMTIFLLTFLKSSIRCACHVINLIVESALKEKEERALFLQENPLQSTQRTINATNQIVTQKAS